MNCLSRKRYLFWLFYNPEEGELAISLSESVYQYQDHSANMANVVVFHRYLKTLFKLRKQQPSLYALPEHVLTASTSEPIAVQEMYFVAESHGFAPNNTVALNIKASLTKYVRYLCSALKFYILLAEQDNKYQMSLATLFLWLSCR